MQATLDMLRCMIEVKSLKAVTSNPARYVALAAGPSDQIRFYYDAGNGVDKKVLEAFKKRAGHVTYTLLVYLIQRVLCASEGALTLRELNGADKGTPEAIAAGYFVKVASKKLNPLDNADVKDANLRQLHLRVLGHLFFEHKKLAYKVPK
jgi:hypothetical protein